MEIYIPLGGLSQPAFGFCPPHQAAHACRMAASYLISKNGEDAKSAFTQSDIKIAICKNYETYPQL